MAMMTTLTTMIAKRLKTNPMKFIALVEISLMVLVVLLKSPVSFAASKKMITCQRPLIVDITHLEPGYIETPRADGSKGIAFDLAEELERRTGCQVVKYVTSMPKALDNMTHFRSDLFLIVGYSPKVKFQSFHLLYKTRKEFVVRKSKYIDNFSLSDYVNKSKIVFGIYQGTQTFLSATDEDKLIKQRRARSGSNPEAMYTLFQKGKVDILFTEPNISTYTINKYNLKDQVVRVMIPGQHIDVGYYLSDKRLRPVERELIVSTMNSIVREGLVKKIMSKYVPLEEYEKYSIEY